MTFSRTHPPKNADKLARYRVTDDSASPDRTSASKDRAISRSKDRAGTR